jgi:hypothetical protein
MQINVFDSKIHYNVDTKQFTLLVPIEKEKDISSQINKFPVSNSLKLDKKKVVEKAAD